MVEVMKITATSLKRSHTRTAIFSIPNPAAGHHQPTPLLETPGYSRASLSLLWGHCYFLLCPGVHKILLYPPRVYFPVLVVYGGVNGNLLKEASWHTHLCCTQSPWPCVSPPLACASTGDGQTKFCLSLCGVPGFCCTQGLFERSERLWWEWGLILNTNSPLLPSYRLAAASPLPLDVGYLLTAAPAKCSPHS